MKTKKLLLLQAFFMLFTFSAISQTIAPGDTVKINFQPTASNATLTPIGYSVDNGLVYASRGTFSYGWITDCSASARQRVAGSIDPTSSNVQFNLSGAVNTWKINLTPGKYSVKLVGGDATYTDSNNSFLLNDGTILADKTPQKSLWDVYRNVSVTVGVDGFLSFTAAHLKDNAKICYIWITNDTPPIATAASAVSSTGFTANWAPVSGATNYLLDVYKNPVFADTIISENFTGITTALGNDLAPVSGSLSLDTYLQTPAWTGAQVLDNVGFARLGTSTAQGQITTPTINLSGNGGNATLKFDVRQHNATDVQIMRVFHAADGVTFVQVGADITPSSLTTWDTKTVNITGGTALSKIRLSAIQVATNRFQIDNISVVQDATLAAYKSLSVSGTSQAVTGLTDGARYYYRLSAVGAATTKSFSNTISVIAVNVNVPVTGVSVSPATSSIALGAIQQLTATIAPADATNKAYTWTSSKNYIATVSATGLVTAVGPGTATITATTADGGFIGTCAITVTGSFPTNLVLNPGFEDGLTNWAITGTSDAVVNTDPLYVFGGTNSVKLGPSANSEISQIVNVTAGKVYILSGVGSQNTSDGSVSRIQIWDVATGNNKYASIDFASASPTRNSLEVTFLTSEAVQIFVYIMWWRTTPGTMPISMPLRRMPRPRKSAKLKRCSARPWRTNCFATPLAMHPARAMHNSKNGDTGQWAGTSTPATGPLTTPVPSTSARPWSAAYCHNTVAATRTTSSPPCVPTVEELCSCMKPMHPPSRSWTTSLAP